MAMTKVIDKCVLCGEPLADRQGMFFGKVSFTTKGSGYAYRVPEGMVRIVHPSNTKQEGGVHMECWEAMINAKPSAGGDSEGLKQEV